MSVNKHLGILRLSGVRMIIKNFSGKKTDFNAEGKRSFGVVLDDPDLVEKLEADGIKVKSLRPRPDDPDGVETKWLKVNVNFNFRQPPKVYLIKADPDDPTNHEKMVRVRLDEDTINQLDWIPSSLISNVEMNIRFSSYPELPGRPAGISNYLDALYVTILDDPLERKYNNIRMVGDDDPGYPTEDDSPFDQ